MTRFEVRAVKVKWLEFENIRTGLKIEKIYFNSDITLLVGLSGVGKTQILNAIEYSLNLAVDKSTRLEPYHASMGVEIDNDEYEWEYFIQIEKNQDLITEGEEYYFSSEKLLKNGEILFVRDDKQVKVTGYEKIPTPKKDESLLVQYAEDSILKKVIAGLRKLYPIELEINVRIGIGKADFSTLKNKIREMIKKNNNTDFRVFSHLPVAMKVYVAKNYYQDLYLKIFDAVKELFMEIQDIDVVEDTSREMYLIAMKVYNKTLLQHEISNGMLKTIYYIVELFTMSKDALVLIDEFENGLGVNWNTEGKMENY